METLPHFRHASPGFKSLTACSLKAAWEAALSPCKTWPLCSRLVFSKLKIRSTDFDHFHYVVFKEILKNTSDCVDSGKRIMFLFLI